MKIFKAALICFSLVFFAFSCAQSENTAENTGGVSTPAATPSPAAAQTPSELALGKQKYDEFCAKCHQDNGSGGRVEVDGKTLKVEDLTSDKMKKEPDEEYIEYMEKGIPDEGMPSFKDEMNQDEMKAVVKYIREELQ